MLTARGTSRVKRPGKCKRFAVSRYCRYISAVRAAGRSETHARALLRGCPLKPARRCCRSARIQTVRLLNTCGSLCDFLIAIYVEHVARHGLFHLSQSLCVAIINSAARFPSSCTSQQRPPRSLVQSPRPELRHSCHRQQQQRARNCHNARHGLVHVSESVRIPGFNAPAGWGCSGSSSSPHGSAAGIGSNSGSRFVQNGTACAAAGGLGHSLMGFRPLCC